METLAKKGKTKKSEFEIIPTFGFDEKKLKEFTKYLSLKIKDTKDKIGIQTVHQARIDVKSERVRIDNDRKKYVSKAVKYQRAVNAEAERIFSFFIPIEKYLQSEEDRILLEKQRIENEKNRLEQEKIQNRTNLLYQYGMVFNGDYYSLGDYSIDVLNVKEFSDGEFNVFIEKIKIEFEKQEVINAKLERIQAEKQLQLDKQAEDQRKEERRLKEIAVDLTLQQENIKNQLKEIKIKKLKELGFVFEEDIFSFKNVNFSLSSVIELNDDEFKNLLIEVSEKIKNIETVSTKDGDLIEITSSEVIVIENSQPELLEVEVTDKEKLFILAKKIEDIEIPELKSDKAKKIANNAKIMLTKLSELIRKDSEKI
jgi:hypothetical protein